MDPEQAEREREVEALIQRAFDPNDDYTGGDEDGRPGDERPAGVI